MIINLIIHICRVLLYIFIQTCLAWLYFPLVIFCLMFFIFLLFLKQKKTQKNLFKENQKSKQPNKNDDVIDVETREIH